MRLKIFETQIDLHSFGLYVRDNRHSLIHQDSWTAPALELLSVSNALGGEVGELQNIVKKIIRDGVLCKDHQLHDAFVLEAGDVLHYLLSLIQLSGHTPEHVMVENVRKLEARKQAQIEAQTTILATSPSESRT